MASKVTVFIDYQNTHRSGHDLYSTFAAPMEKTLIDPLKLAERVVSKRPLGGTLEHVYVFRGRPNPNYEPTLAAANEQQFSAWMKDSRVTVIRRTLQYPSDFGQPSCTEAPREKGIDVALAIKLIDLSLGGKLDVAILISRDTDFTPVLEMVTSRRLAHLEIASWADDTHLPNKHCYWHKLYEDDFLDCRDTRTYTPTMRHARRVPQGLTQRLQLPDPGV